MSCKSKEAHTDAYYNRVNSQFYDFVFQCKQLVLRNSYYILICCRDEKLLAQGLELHEVMQNLLAKHDGIASVSVLPSHTTDIASTSLLSQPTISSPPATENFCQPHEQKKDISPKASVSCQSAAATTTLPKDFIDEEEEEDDDFAQLARRLGAKFSCINMMPLVH